MKRRFTLIAIFILGFCSSFAVHAGDSPEVESSDYQFQGTHFLSSYSECDYESLCDVQALSQALLEAVQNCGATILKSCDYVFPPNGFTMVVLLSESHASIHTYPEHRSCFVDLFTCGNKCSFEKFDAALRAYLQPKAVNSKVLIRGDEIYEMP
jgi:S-adenosylmethionine decarboxylase